jgi:SAM-dependent methyltransferase
VTAGPQAGAGDGGPAPQLPSAAVPWDERYARDGRRWGEGPGEVGVVAAREMREAGLTGPGVSVLDIGCGYGRDVLYLWETLGVEAVGIDPSPEAIALAVGSIPTGASVRFERRGFAGSWDRRFDVVLSWNVFHLLPKPDREAFAAAVPQLLRPGGRLFLGTLSPRDTEHVGAPEPGGPPGAPGVVPLHFATERELREQFAGLRIERLFEHEYEEPLQGRPAHHHNCWILVAAAPGS